MLEYDRLPIVGIITRQLRDAKRELVDFHNHLKDRVEPPELAAYSAKLEMLGRALAHGLNNIERDLARGLDDLLEDLRSATAQTTQAVQILTRRLAAPVIAPTNGDRVALRLLQWIHGTDGGTADMPTACCDGEPSVYPFVIFAPLYAFPRLTRESLLYLAIFFHEFGHVLFRQHRRELEDLVRELQEWISEQLEPLSTRSDLLVRQQRQFQRDVVDTWYPWTQEFFCDAVGLTMCGPAYLHAFASYVTRLEHGDFRRSRSELRRSSHPVLWLRIRLLASRARQLGWLSLADDYERHWNSLASMLSVSMDYFGFFEDSWQLKVEGVISDMLIETDPRPCTSAEIAAGDSWQSIGTPVALLNAAWSKYHLLPDEFEEWERTNSHLFLS